MRRPGGMVGSRACELGAAGSRPAFGRIFVTYVTTTPKISRYTVGGRAKQTFWRTWALPGMPLATLLFETNVSRVSHASDMLVSNYSYFMLVLLYIAYNSGIIHTKIVTYYS